ncbi:hypothetical protein GCM10022226_75300 [Sphaerisporangium flaviroseum]|uniref:CDP-alcohol phosphatidyltransferase n=2 Tax=Sphaerisporangium flaviroseum TaxID=509199 RepID=A0ABP7JD04_9ACTN
MVDPVACRVALFVANRTEITPNALTRFSLILGMASAACFAANSLMLGAALFYVSFMVDCVDGKIARLKGTGTPFGLWLDYVGDRIRVVFCAMGLAYGQYVATGRLAYVLLGAGIAILDLFRYVNAPQMKRVRQTVKSRRRVARREELAAMREAMALESLGQGAGYDVSYSSPLTPPHEFPDYAAVAHEPADHGDHVYESYEPADRMPTPYEPPAREPGHDAGYGATIPRQASAHADSFAATQPISRRALSHAPPSPGAAPYDQEKADPYEPADARMSVRQRFGQFLARHRVRTHLMSGIEFHAAVFVLAPLIGPAALLPVTTGAGALLVLNEIFLVYRMWLSTRAPAARTGSRPPGPDDQQHVRTDPFFTGV